MIRNQKGFTLIEIIAVLVILGILAAVAIPKYFDLQTEAKNKAATAAVSEAKGMLSVAWGKATLAAGVTPTIAQVLSQMPTWSTVAGDFQLSYGSVSPVLITASGTTGGALSGTATGSWTLP